MTRRLLVVIAALAAAPPASADPPVELTQVDVGRFPDVTVYFRVPGRGAARDGDIGADQVTVFEDDAAVPVTGFRGFGDVRARTVLLVDTSGSMAERVPDGGTRLDAARRAARSFLAAARPGDEVAVIGFDTAVRTLAPLGPPGAATGVAVDGLRADGKTAWRDAVGEALGVLAAHPGRRNVLLLSDGQDNASRRGLGEVTGLARQVQVPVLAVGLGGAGDVDEAALQALAAETGGWYLRTPDPAEVVTRFESAGRAVREEAAVTYRSSRATPDGTRRRVRVVVRTAAGEVSGGTEYLEQHLLNVRSDPFAFAVLAAVVGLLYAGPGLVAARRAAAERAARTAAFLDPPVPPGPPPRVTLTAAVDPEAVPASPTARSVTCRLTVAADPGRGPLVAQPLALAVLLDLSASMEGDRLAAARVALGSLLDGLGDDDAFCLIGFSAAAELVVPPVRAGDGGREIARRGFDGLRVGTSTALAPALDLLAATLPAPDPGGRRKRAAVIVSDGKAEDSPAARAARDRLPTGLAVAALGIGPDYDRGLLAHVCGDPRMVDHLETAAEAGEAFARFVGLYGHTLTARSRLRLAPADGVRVESVTAVRHTRSLPAAGEVPVADLPLGGVGEYLVRLVFTPAAPGRRRLADVTLGYDLPGYGRSDLSTAAGIAVEVTPGGPERPNPDVRRTTRLVQAGKMVEAAGAELANNRARATQLFRDAAPLFADAGAADRAADVSRFADDILPATASAEELANRVGGLTKRVTEDRPPPTGGARS